MSTLKNSDDELAGLRVSELKKLCKMNNLPISGTKAELMGRILENKAIDGHFSALPPEEEARLLGDDDEESVVKVGGNQITPSTTTTGTVVDDDYATLDDPMSDTIEGANLLASCVDSSAPPTKITGDSVGSEQKPFIPTSVNGPIAENVIEDDDDDDEEGPTVVKLRAVSTASDSDHLAVRVDRFGSSRPAKPMGDNLSDAKLVARAKRFGLPIGDHSSAPGYTALGKLSDTERLKQRAARFGTADSSGPAAVDMQVESERKALRMQRFNATNENTTNSSLSTQAGQKSEEERKTARAIKFGITISGPPSSANNTPNLTGQETVLTKAAF